MRHSLVTVTAFVLLGLITFPSHGQGKFSLSKGAYRMEGKCARTFYLGASSQPACQSYMGISTTDPALPMFIFPLEGTTWFFVSSGLIKVSEDNSAATYAISKLFDQALGAEFRYAEGECELSMRGSAPVVRCTVWKDKERTTVARELLFASSGMWRFSRGQ